jgi:hypothetical protein
MDTTSIHADRAVVGAGIEVRAAKGISIEFDALLREIDELDTGEIVNDDHLLPIGVSF